MVFQGVMEEEAVLSGDNAFNAHFGECIAAIGDIDDDGYQGQPKQFTLCLLVLLAVGIFLMPCIGCHRLVDAGSLNRLQGSPGTLAARWWKHFSNKLQPVWMLDV